MSLDTQLFYLLNGLAGQSPLLDGLIVFCATYVAYVAGAALLALVFFSSYSKWQKWEILIAAGLASGIGRGVVEIFRFFYHHPRPFVALPGVHALFTDSAWSFPSGHATFFFALATAIYLYNKKWGIGFFAAAALIAIARVIAGVHYPSDIIGGTLIGVVIAWGVVWAIRRVDRNSITTLDKNKSIG